jgi:hypothetical protein
VSHALPATGTAELLDWLADYPPDDFINELVPRISTGGRRYSLTLAGPPLAAQPRRGLLKNIRPDPS